MLPVTPRSEPTFGQQFARALEGREQCAPIAGVAIHPRLLGLLLRPVRRLAAQAEITIETQLQRAVLVGEQLVDDRALARAACLEEGHLAFGLEADDLAQVVARDRRLAHDMRRA